MLPMQVQPQAVTRVWGGQQLFSLRNFPASAEPVGESWEVFGESVVLAGANAGKTLDQLCLEQGRDLLGHWWNGEPGFPLLLKWLDCQEWLSLQVHPDDQVARDLKGPEYRGKSEAWYFHRVAPGAEVIHGWLSRPPEGTELEQLRGAAWLDWVRRYRPEAGRWVDTPPGTVHALGPGLLVFEVQQNSDLTFRLYDWDRVGLDGEPRPLHLREGVEAIRRCRPAQSIDRVGTEVENQYFSVERHSGPRRWSPQGLSVELLTLLEGQALVDCQGQRWALSAMDSLVIPARCPEVSLTTRGPWFRVRLADPSRNHGTCSVSNSISLSEGN